jgi:hypothetical protein
VNGPVLRPCAACSEPVPDQDEYPFDRHAATCPLAALWRRGFLHAHQREETPPDAERMSDEHFELGLAMGVPEHEIVKEARRARRSEAALREHIESVEAGAARWRLEHDRAQERVRVLHNVLSAVRAWCHDRHGGFPAAQCGLCGPVVRALAAGRGAP